MGMVPCWQHICCVGSLHIRRLPDPYPLPSSAAALGLLSCKGMALLRGIYSSGG